MFVQWRKRDFAFSRRCDEIRIVGTGSNGIGSVEFQLDQDRAAEFGLARLEIKGVQELLVGRLHAGFLTVATT